MMKSSIDTVRVLPRNLCPNNDRLTQQQSLAFDRRRQNDAPSMMEILNSSCVTVW